MKAINRKSKIKILWKVWRGVNKISEDFNSLNTNLKVFLVGGCDTYAMGHVINREVEPGYDVIEIDVYPNTLAEGAYNLKALWTKNQGRDVLTSMRSGVFGITSNVEEAEVKDEEVRLVSMVESYGRDGMSAFETAVFRGLEAGSEKEWVTRENDFVHNEAARKAAEAAREERMAGYDKEIDDFKNLITNQVENYKPIEIHGDVVNAPDEEDITSDGDNLLKLKNRSQLYGMGYVILRRDKSFTEQIIDLGTIYEVRYNFDLGGKRVAIPADCVLKYVGGSLSNGTIVYNNTIVEGIERLNNVVTEGEFKYPYTSDESNSDTQLSPTMAQFRKLNTRVDNIADDEDLTKIYDDEKGQEVLQLKNRQYIQDSNNGMGYVILRQNKSFKEQLTQSNTIYEIRYDFDLGGEEVEIPKNCVLKFDGGSLNNGIIKGNKTLINNTLSQAFSTSIKLSGTWNIECIYPEWFGAGKTLDDTSALECCFQAPVKIIVFSKMYTISRPIKIGYGYTLIGKNDWFELIGLKASEDFSSVTINGTDINSMFYFEYDSYHTTIKGLYFNGNYKVDTLINHLNHTAIYNISDCIFKRFYGSAIIIPGGDSSSCKNCEFKYNRIGIASNGVDYTNVYKANTAVSRANNIIIKNCKFLLNCFGTYFNWGSDVHVSQCLYGSNAASSIIAYNITTLLIEQVYIEADFNLGFFIEKNQAKDPIIDGTINSELSNMLGGRNRRYIDTSNSSIGLSGAFVSHLWTRLTEGKEVNATLSNNDIKGVDFIVGIAGAGAGLSVDNLTNIYQGANTGKLAYHVYVNRVDKSIPANISSDEHINIFEEIKLRYNIPRVIVPNRLLIDIEWSNSYAYINENVLSESHVKFNNNSKYIETVGTIDMYRQVLNAHQANSIKINAESLKAPFYIRYYTKQRSDINIGFRVVLVYKNADDSKILKNYEYRSAENASSVLTCKEMLFNPQDYVLENLQMDAIFISMIATGSSSDNYEYSSLIIDGGNEILTLDRAYCNANTRPDNYHIGSSMFDDTIKKPIWWTGDKWVDATGAEVV